MKPKAESTKFVLDYLKKHPGSTAWEIITAAPRGTGSKIYGAVRRLSARGDILTDRFKTPHKFYPPVYLGIVVPIDDLNKLCTWFSQFPQFEKITVKVLKDELPITIIIKG